MAVVLTPLGKAVVGTTKWILVPLAIGFIGYKFIGPSIGASDKPKPSAAKAKRNLPISENGKAFREVRDH